VNQGRVCVVGCGHVGTTSAYALMLGGLAREVVLLDVDARRAEGEALRSRAAERHSEDLFVSRLLELYERALA
jgi:malate/lactate dehydrogenase